MYNPNRIPSSSRPSEAWQEAVVRDRGGEGSSSARSRAFPSQSLPARPFPSRPPAARTSASHPFASPLPASNPFASRLPASRPLSAPRDGSDGSSLFYATSSERSWVSTSAGSWVSSSDSDYDGPH